MTQKWIEIQNCSVKNGMTKTVQRVDWTVNAHGEAWLITGTQSSAKADFLKALSGQLQFYLNEVPLTEKNVRNEPFCHINAQKVELVSLEAAAALIEEERKRDDSEVLGREDEGRTARTYLAEVLTNVPPSRIETLPAVKLCGIESILDTGLRYLSTGEIRRTLLCRALLGNADIIILSDPFSGLDAEARSKLLAFFDSLLARQIAGGEQKSAFPHIIMSMERFLEIPQSINRVLAFTQNGTSVCYDRADYEKNLLAQTARTNEERDAFVLELRKICEQTGHAFSEQKRTGTLVRFENVTVGWGERTVLKNMNWQVAVGDHHLIVGPNGSGKTTILELITGDNMQVFREAVYLFGSRRGTGETIWDIKKRLGIVSYRLHVEYRMVGGTSLRDVIISGFYDSIGLYEAPGDYEIATARQWLSLSGLCKKGSSVTENTPFGSLSYGEQRVALILRAAVKSPGLFILDEPCHSLNEAQRALVLTVLEEIATMGTTTMLHVTHDRSEALSCEHTVLELLPGQSPMYRIYKR